MMERWYPEVRVAGHTHVDGTVAFYTMVRSLLTPASVVLDVGCGRGAYGDDRVATRRDLRILRTAAARVIGYDVDPAARENPFMDEVHVSTEPRWPIDDASVDLVVADNVVEHLPDPAAFLAEAHRVLRPGGHLCMRTPNVLSYFGIISRLIPNALHARLVARLQRGRKEQDVFPTLYRSNTLRVMRRNLRAAGFEILAVYGHEPEPAYLSFSRIAYALGVLYQRVVPSTFRTAMFAFARKPETTTT